MASLFVIIPALNAAASLPATMASLEEGVRARLIGGLILADGGSGDTTRTLAERSGFQVIQLEPGRGGQLAGGADLAGRQTRDEDWYLFLHADTRLQPGWSAEVRRFMERYQDQNRAAAFRFALDDVSGSAQRLERFVNWRCQMFGLPYGDQGLLISRRFYEALGGYRPWPLFEDVDLVRRIGKRRLSALRTRAITSAERFNKEGYLKRSARNLLLLLRYFLGADPVRLARAYRK